MQGTSATAFSPGRTTTRGQIAAILHRLEGSPRAGSRPSPTWRRAATAPTPWPGRSKTASSGALRTAPSAPTAHHPPAAGGHPVPVPGAPGGGHGRPGGSGPLLRHRRRGGLRPGGHGLGGVRRAAPGPVRRDLGSVRLRHPGPDGGDPPPAGHAAGRKRIETSKQETAGGGLLFSQACGMGRRGRPACRPVDQGPVPCAVGAAICRPGDNGAGNAGA